MTCTYVIYDFELIFVSQSAPQNQAEKLQSHNNTIYAHYTFRKSLNQNMASLNIYRFYAIHVI